MIPLPRAVALVAAGVLGLTACSSAADVRNASGGSQTESPASSGTPGTPSVSTPTTATPTSASATASAPPSTEPPTSAPLTTMTATLAPPVAGTPRTGNCYATTTVGFRHQVDGSSPVLCGQRHTAETFWVVIDKRPGGGTQSRAIIDAVWRDCANRFKAYVGDSPTISTIGMTVILPSAAQRAAGQSWLRCDALELANYNQPHSLGKSGVVRVGSLAGALSGGVPDRFRGCARHWPKVDQAVHFTSCDQSHQAELIPESLDLGPPNAPYPGMQAAISSSKTFCGSVFQDYVPETVNYYYYYPTPQSWKSGTHDTTCWALDTAGDGIPPI